MRCKTLLHLVLPLSFSKLLFFKILGDFELSKSGSIVSSVGVISQILPIKSELWEILSLVGLSKEVDAVDLQLWRGVIIFPSDTLKGDFCCRNN